MDVVDTWTTGTFIFSGPIIVWVCLPLLMQLLGVSFTSYRVLNTPQESLFVSDDPIPPQVFSQLHDLGFEPLGMLLTLHWFTGPLFLEVIRSRVFVSANGECVASIFRLSVGEEPRIRYESHFTDGAGAFTANYSSSKREQPDLVCQSIVTANLHEQFDKHLEAVSRMMPGREIKCHRALDDLISSYRTSWPVSAKIDRRVPLYFLWRYLPAFGIGLMMWYVVEVFAAQAFLEPFEVHSSTIGTASLATAGLLLAIRHGFLRRIPAQRQYEMDRAANSIT